MSRIITINPFFTVSLNQTLHSEIVIIGAGPGGLACAGKLADHGREVLVVERKAVPGPKVCAGGITWDGLLRIVPEHLIEQSFCEQHIFSNRQQIVVREKNPIIATINRKILGSWMARQAEQAGANILTNTRVIAIDGKRIVIRHANGSEQTLTCSHLVGADGAHSLVRRALGIPTTRLGPGINYQIAGTASRMEWHLNTRAFGYGYGWIFPHKETISIGAYGPMGNMSGSTLKKNLISWARQQGHELAGASCQAAFINYDYQGYDFDTIWLVGDAAGLASGLTGEGIYPAIVSGETVARKIINPKHSDAAITRMVKKQLLHHRVIQMAAKHPRACSLLMEGLILMLRWNIITFHALEMG